MWPHKSVCSFTQYSELKLLVKFRLDSFLSLWFPQLHETHVNRSLRLRKHDTCLNVRGTFVPIKGGPCKNILLSIHSRSISDALIGIVVGCQERQ